MEHESISNKNCSIKWRKNKIRLRKNLENLKYRIQLHFEDMEKQNVNPINIQLGDQKLRSDNCQKQKEYIEQYELLMDIECEYENNPKKQEIQLDNIGNQQSIRQISQDVALVVEIDSQDYSLRKEDNSVKESSCWKTSEKEGGQLDNTSEIQFENIQKTMTFEQMLSTNIEETGCIQQVQPSYEIQFKESSAEGSEKSESVPQQDCKLSSDQQMVSLFHIRIGHVESIESSLLESSFKKQHKLISTNVDQRIQISKLKKWEKSFQKTIHLTYNKKSIPLKAILYELDCTSKLDVILEIWRLIQNYPNLENTQIMSRISLKERNQKNNSKIEPIGRIKIKEVQKQMINLLRQNMEILIGFYLKIDKKGQLSINRNQITEEQIINLIRQP